MAVAAALLGGGAAQAQGRGEAAQAAFERDFCPGLKRLVEAAAEARTKAPEDAARIFTDIYNAHPTPPWFGFRPGACRASKGTDQNRAGYWCHQSLAPAHLSLETLAAATAACLPEAKRTRGRWGRDVTFTLPGARILINESGGPKAKVGRIVGYMVEAVAAPSE